MRGVRALGSQERALRQLSGALCRQSFPPVEDLHQLITSSVCFLSASTGTGIETAQLSANMSVLISQSVINYVEEENIPALKALLEKCKDVDERNEVRPRPLPRS